MQKDDDVRLRHMLDAARQAVEFARGRARLDILWQTVQRDLSPLIARLEDVLSGES